MGWSFLLDSVGHSAIQLISNIWVFGELINISGVVKSGAGRHTATLTATQESLLLKVRSTFTGSDWMTEINCWINVLAPHPFNGYVWPYHNYGQSLNLTPLPTDIWYSWDEIGNFNCWIYVNNVALRWRIHHHFSMFANKFLLEPKVDVLGRLWWHPSLSFWSFYIQFTHWHDHSLAADDSYLESTTHDEKENHSLRSFSARRFVCIQMFQVPILLTTSPTDWVSALAWQAY